ncbi:MAG: DUF4974 domain-containing protein [Cytophagales bacterium]|nr:DUF4974 domain-containing protein [Cytophagales bacterium]
MNTDIDRIIYKSLTNNANEKERDQLNRWLNASAQNRRVFQHLKKDWATRTPEPTLINEDEVLERIWNEGTDISSRSTSVISLLWKVAASLLVILTLGYLVFSIIDKQDRQKTDVVRKKIIKENPVGQKSKLFLPDGSIVWLNAASSIQYWDTFTDSSRIVVLEGEAYFEVAKDSLRSFIVETFGISTEALGTVFNINSYAEDLETKISLISGKVKVSSYDSSFFLNPGNAISFDNDTHTPKRYNFDISEVPAWKDGIFILKNAEFDEVITKLERWYGVHIHVEGPSPDDWQISGRFDNKYLVDVLELMQYSREFDFRLKNKDLYITIN